MTRQDPAPRASRALLSDKLAAPAPARRGRSKLHARRPELSELLRRTLAALERDLPALRAAELSRGEVAAFLVEQLGALPEVGALSEPGAPAPVRAGSKSGEAGADGPSSDGGAAQAAVLDALRQLERESPPGALLSVRELRARSDLSKQSFDRAALQLAVQGRVSLHAHDHVGALSEVARCALIEDVRGVHYVGIASIPDACHEVSP